MQLDKRISPWRNIPKSTHLLRVRFFASQTREDRHTILAKSPRKIVTNRMFQPLQIEVSLEHR
jgi:hypothetical protein